MEGKTKDSSTVRLQGKDTDSYEVSIGGLTCQSQDRD